MRGLEIERKILVNKNKLTKLTLGTPIEQGFIVNNDNVCVRIRISQDKAYLTIKSDKRNITRIEYEYPIPLSDARHLLENLCSGLVIEKTRYNIVYEGQIWELDVFEGENKGLVLADVELRSESQSFLRPAWLAKEVTNDSRYYNRYLANYPYNKWR